MSSELTSLKEQHSAEVEELRQKNEQEVKMLMELLTEKDQEVISAKEEANKVFSESQEHARLTGELRQKDLEIAQCNEQLEQMNQQLEALEAKKNPAGGKF